jgi:hypothetical protein
MLFAFSPQSMDQKASSILTVGERNGIHSLVYRPKIYCVKDLFMFGKFKKTRHLNIRCLSDLIFFRKFSIHIVWDILPSYTFDRHQLVAIRKITLVKESI